MEQVFSPALKLGPQTWFFAFEHAESVWWHRWLKRGYAHCFAFGFDGEAWLVVDPAFEGLIVRRASADEVEGWFARASLGGLRLWRVPVQGQAVVRPRWVVTCAGALAAIVGFRETPLTPWGLICIARRHGATEIRADG